MQKTAAESNRFSGYLGSSVPPGFAAGAGWKGLLFLNTYRIGVAIFMLALEVGDVIQVRLPEVEQILALVIWIYLGLSISQAFAGMLLHNIPHLVQVSSGMLLDVVVFAILNFSVSSGDYFNILLLVSLSGAAVLARGYLVWVYASMTVLALLFQALQLFLLGVREEHHFIPVTIYCIMCYVVVAGARWLSDHIERTENIAVSIAAHLGHISERIIDILRAGIVVIDDSGKVLFANRPTINLLQCKQEPGGMNLRQLSPELAELVARADADPEDNNLQFNGIDSQVIKLPRRYGIGTQKLITMEQSSIVQQQAETIKNASLARMAGSITHEIRNPLGAISHAAQLLQEDASLGEDGREMVSVIIRQANRMNTIVSNITQMGRSVPSSTTIRLLPWVRGVASELRQVWSLKEHDLVVKGSDSIMAEVDKSQLHQVLTNLCENARRHSTGSPLVSLSIGKDGDMYSYIDIADTGPGITADKLQYLFEPFSSDSGGLGLGLYISRELVRANGGSLLLLASGNSGSVFRLRLQQG